MLLVAPVKSSKKIEEDNPDASKLLGFDKLKAKRAMIPAVTHVDYSARIQTIKRDDNPLYYDTINEFYKKTGCLSL